MDFEKLLSERSSIRSFQDRDVSKEVVKDILSEANKAPSAGNRQARDFVIVRDEGKKKEISRASYDQMFIADAPVVVVVVANEERTGKKYGARGRNLYSIIDSALACQNLMLSVTDKGLGTVYIGAFDEDKISEIVGTPSYARPIGIFPIGHPEEKGRQTSRLELEEIVHEEEF